VRLWILPVVLTAFVVPAANAADTIRTQRVRFEHGASSAVVEDSITGYEIIDYVVGAGKGQYMNVSMATKNTANYFNILAPGESEVAFFNGSLNQNQYEGTLPASGDYKIRVYLMRSAARRNEKASYRLEMIITGANGALPKTDGNHLAGDALVAGTPYHATGDVRCTMTAARPAGMCPFGVTREGNGSGSVTVTKPDGRKRVIFFEKGKATGADVSSADPGEFSASREGDNTIVLIGHERYEIPDAVIFGG
jgi:hypothetical protein